MADEPKHDGEKLVEDKRRYDDWEKPRYVWIGFGSKSGLPYIFSCTEHGRKYGSFHCGCSKGRRLVVTNQITLVNLYNALHEALVEKELEP